MEISTGNLVREWLSGAGVNASTAARRAGVSASTLHRILTGQVDPSTGTLREIAIGCGVDLSLVTRPLSDWRAAAAARLMLEEGYITPDDSDGQIAAWASRLIRLARTDNAVEIVAAAAQASAPMYRAVALWYEGTASVGRIASAGDASGGSWALSGAAGLYLPESGESAPPVTILWCSDVRVASQMLAGGEMRAIDRLERATLVVVQGETELFAGSFTRGLVRYAAPIQIMLDCISLGGAVASDAREEVMSW